MLSYDSNYDSNDVLYFPSNVLHKDTGHYLYIVFNKNQSGKVSLPSFEVVHYHVLYIFVFILIIYPMYLMVL